jgi:hypothetical protein
MAKKQKPVIYRSLAGDLVEPKHLITQKDFAYSCGEKRSNGTRKSLIPVLFENPHHDCGLAQLAQAEAQALSRTREGQMKLIAILMYIAEQKERNRVTVEQLFRRLMLPKE